MKGFFKHLRTYIFRGLLAIVPLALSFFSVKILYTAIDKRIILMVERFFDFTFPGLGVLLVLAALYHVVKSVNAMNRKHNPPGQDCLPGGKATGGEPLTSGAQAFKRAVLVEYLKPGIWTIGFVTGKVIDKTHDGEVLLKVFVPTPPNPTSGTMVVVRESETRDPGWSVEESLKSVISAGVIGPVEIKQG